MDIDWYDDELPDVKPTLVETFKENKEFIKLAGKFVGIPTGLFALTCVVNYWIRNLETL